MQGGKGSLAIEESRKQFFKTQMCRFFIANTCTRGNSCSFAHDSSELKRTPNLRKISLCPEWQKGTCPLSADQCRFAHGRRELRSNKGRLGAGGKQTDRQAKRNESSNSKPISTDVYSTEGNLAQRKPNFETDQSGQAGILQGPYPQTNSTEDQLRRLAMEASLSSQTYPIEPSQAPPLPRWCLPLEQKKHVRLKDDSQSEALSGSGSESSSEFCSTRVGSSSNGSEPQGRQQLQQTRGTSTYKAHLKSPSLRSDMLRQEQQYPGVWENPTVDFLTDQEAKEQMEQDLETLRMYKPKKASQELSEYPQNTKLPLQRYQMQQSTAAPPNLNTVAKVHFEPEGVVTCFEPLGLPLKVQLRIGLGGEEGVDFGPDAMEI